MFVHRIDPILFDAAGLHFWWYGLSYALGFLEIHLWFLRARRRLGLTVGQVYSLSIFFAASVLFFGRAIEVIFYEGHFYRAHPWHVFSLWLGGMCTHGILVGAVAGTWLFCRLNGKSFLAVADELVIPGAFLMGVGRIGNFIDGQIVGRVTDLPWAVQFPDAEGFRHPVVLYDGLKNLLLIPLLLGVRKYSKPVPGKTMAHFVFWYGFLRFFVDIYREYPTRMFGIGTGQSFNIFMSVVGLILLAWFSRWHQGARAAESPPPACPPKPWRRREGWPTCPPKPWRRWKAGVGRATHPSRPLQGGDVPHIPSDAFSLWAKRAVFAFLLVFSLLIPSDWTQDVPSRYGKRHPGLAYSCLYPRVDSAPPARR